jgi:hypothetical protein
MAANVAAKVTASSHDMVMYPSSHCTDKESMCFYPELNKFVSYEVLVGGHIAYLVVIYVLKTVMAKREKPIDPKIAMYIYNPLQVVLSSMQVIGLAPFILNYVFNLNGQFCGRIEFWIFFHYCTKFLDMFDSVFMCLRKKADQLSFLHVYHHLTIGFIWGLLLHHGVANGAAFFGAWINSLVHALMYFHYFWTSLGFRNPFKRFLTQFQMFQFCLCIVQAVLVFPFDRQIPVKWGALQLTYHCTLLYLFANFYQTDRKREKKVLTSKKQ